MYGGSKQKARTAVGKLAVLSWASKLFAFKVEVERKRSVFENKLECQGFPWQSFILLILVITVRMLFTAPANKVAMLGIFPIEVEGKHRQRHAVHALHAVPEMLKAHEILLWSSCGFTRSTSG